MRYPQTGKATNKDWNENYNNQILTKINYKLKYKQIFIYLELKYIFATNFYLHYKRLK